MHFSEKTLDDILNKVLSHLTSKDVFYEATRGRFTEEVGVMIELSNPRARLSRSDSRGKAFSALGELMWYLAGSDNLDFISNYVEQYKKEQIEEGAVYGAYGPRLFHLNGIINQVDNVLSLLKSNSGTRKAVIQLFEAKDIQDIEPDVVRSAPCTCLIHLLLRDKKLNMIVYMRSNDAFIGLPHDIFAFTMLQEIFASELMVELGRYTHFVGSLHLYERNIPQAKEYLQEGFQSTIDFMSAMPSGTTLIELKKVIMLEENIRKKNAFNIENEGLDPYWKNLAYLLAFFQAHKDENEASMKDIKSKISDEIYHPILEKKILSSHAKKNAE